MYCFQSNMLSNDRVPKGTEYDLQLGATFVCCYCTTFRDHQFVIANTAFPKKVTRLLPATARDTLVAENATKMIEFFLFKNQLFTII